MERKLALRARVPPTQVFGGLGQKPLLDLANDLGNQIAAPDDRALIQRKLSYSLLMATLYMPSVLDQGYAAGPGDYRQPGRKGRKISCFTCIFLVMYGD